MYMNAVFKETISCQYISANSATHCVMYILNTLFKLPWRTLTAILINFYSLITLPFSPKLNYVTWSSFLHISNFVSNVFRMLSKSSLSLKWERSTNCDNYTRLSPATFHAQHHIQPTITSNGNIAVKDKVHPHRTGIPLTDVCGNIL